MVWGCHRLEEEGVVSQRILSCPKWEEGSEERESVIAGEVSNFE